MPGCCRRCWSLPRGKIVVPRVDIVALLILWKAAFLCEAAFVVRRFAVGLQLPSRSIVSASATSSSTPPQVDLPRTGPRSNIDESASGDAPLHLERERFLVHRGKSADMIFRAPAISGITVCKNWTPSATQALMDATQELVRINPILSGIVVRQGGNCVETGELWIEAGWYPPDQHCFVSIVPVPDSVTHQDLSDRSGSSTEMLAYVTDRIEPSFHHVATSTALQAEKRLPVLDVSIMVVPRSDDAVKQDGNENDGDCAIFSFTVSHAVGDGVTVFQILRQLSVLVSNLDASRNMNGLDEGTSPSPQLLPVPDIDWTFRSHSRADHEIYPVTYSRRDVDVAYGVPYLVGLVKSAILTLSKRRPTVILLDKDKVRQEKLKMRKLTNCTSVSSNDVVSLALCESNGDQSDVFIFTENARDGDSIPRNAGGNYFWEIPFPSRDAVRDPRLFRAVVDAKQPVYATNQLPVQPFVCGKVGRLTSLATVVSEPIAFGNVETVGTFPVTSFLVGIPMDVALIFRYNKQYLGVLHNFVEVDECRSGSLLDSILVRGP